MTRRDDHERKLDHLIRAKFVAETKIWRWVERTLLCISFPVVVLVFEMLAGRATIYWTVILFILVAIGCICVLMFYINRTRRLQNQIDSHATAEPR
jgi:hypothetical protein